MLEPRRKPAGTVDIEATLRLAIEGLKDHAFLTCDTQGLITSWNVGAATMFACPRERALGASISGLLKLDGQATALDLPLNAVGQQGTVTFGRSFDLGDERQHIAVSVSAIRADGPLLGYAVLAYRIAAPAQPDVTLSTPGRHRLGEMDDVNRALSQSNALLASEMGERAQAEMQRLRLLRRLIGAQEEERRRIARDLHDGLGQRLTVLRLTLEAIRSGDKDPSRVSEEITQALEVLQRIDREVDFIAWELRPAALDELGLSKVLATFVAEWSKHTGVRATFHNGVRELTPCAPEIESCVYRIAQEALHNVAKHAHATSVEVLFEQHGSALVLTVEDDGVGLSASGTAETMIGLRGMRERAAGVGGTLEIEPTPGGGTTVRTCIPLSPLLSHDAFVAAPLDVASTGSGIATASRDDEGAVVDRLRRRLRELQQAAGARDEFIATVAHELRNPIAPLYFQVRLAIDKAEQMRAAGESVPADWVEARLRSIEQRLHRLLETLDRLLDVSRLSTGRIDLQPEPMDLASAVREVAATFDAELAMARCTLTLVHRGEATGCWDRLRVEQICRNLLSNAARFGAGRPIEITVSADDEVATLQVRDHGVGIPHAQLAKIFERFERGVEQRSGGFGVGLWIVGTICAAMGGTVSVESQVGEGATFTVTIPRRKVADCTNSGSESI